MTGIKEEKISIFYTDDDRDDIELFVDAVAYADKEVNVFTHLDGRDMIHLLNNDPKDPSLVFLDWNMPGKSGADVLKELRSSEKIKKIPVAILSTSGNKEDIAEARRLGANYFITKPVKFKELVKVVEHCLAIDWNTFRPDEKEFYYNKN